MRTHVVLLAAAALLIVLACGCTSLPGSGIAEYTVQSVYDEDTAYEKGISAPVPATVRTDNAAVYAAEGAAIERKMIMTGSVELEVADVEAAAEALAAIADAHGGYVSSSNLRKNPEGRDYATVVIRVPSESFTSALDAVGNSGTVLSRSTNANDVTEEYIDLEARLTALEAQLAQYQRIMEKAEEVEDILQIQVQIERVQVEIEQITGRMKYLNDRIDFATITVSVTEPTPVGGDVGHDFAEVFNEAIRAFLATVDLLIVAFFGLLPLILLGGGAWAIYRWKKGRSQPVATAEEQEK